MKTNNSQYINTSVAKTILCFCIALITYYTNGLCAINFVFPCSIDYHFTFRVHPFRLNLPFKLIKVHISRPFCNR